MPETSDRDNGLARWIPRVVLASAAFVFAMIGFRYIVDPLHASAATGATLHSALARTTARVGFGAFPLGFAIFTLSCLSARSRYAIGVRFVAIVIASAIAVRIVGTLADGPTPESTRLFVPEGVMFGLAVAGIALERPKRRQYDRFSRENV